MSVRSSILKKITESLQNVSNTDIYNISSYLRLEAYKGNGMYSFLLPLRTKDYDIQSEAQNIMNNDQDNIYDNINIKNNIVSFDISREICIKKVLEDNCLTVSAPTFTNNKRKNVIVEFSSPNIAKPFHVGHLRSTIIGNYVANISSFADNNNVKRINYLGDWGTQYGLVQLGVDLAGINEDEMKKSPIKALYTAYVTANKLVKTNPSILERAREIFNNLENGITSGEQWETYKQYTIEELKQVYNRIGITFDEYHWESMYNAKNIKKVITLMEEMQLLTIDKQGRKIVSLNDGKKKKNLPVIKSDGSTLYIARDIAAAMDRFEKNTFDCMYYVVDNAQIGHFSNLLEILKQMEVPWAERLKHIRFGRINGMSTRKGNMVFLEDILDTARDIMKQRQLDSPTTKVSMDLMDNSSDILGISAMIISDLKRSRQRDYTFNWDTAFNFRAQLRRNLNFGVRAKPFTRRSRR
ncbi:PREDICTED: probable arginine--tRNA ligase, mitochondrial isoform X2 [Dinoponera quadriceps]|uniref:Probable arginine--tRNA ligase, mitochondrial n=1 Tax=Dinoponera quadriceps TaxID=609295 RepID=A0A6P3X9X4_DINQU|nr:PREDICTED: probable arginine--tRNA ligase, mitochondrial isoform X2 [Dinoponera quadriceps]